jgi:hypothetical protein
MVERGELQTYEVVWTNGHVEQVPAHQVTWTGALLGYLFGDKPDAPPRIRFHAEINGQWLLVLDALEQDIRTVRLVTQGEGVPRG